MTQLTVPNPQDLQGQVLYDVSGDGIGVIQGIYLDNATREPEWAAVQMGPDAIALVPLGQASYAGGSLRVEFTRDMVEQAPFRLTALDNEVTEDTEQLLYDYYATGGTGSRSAAVQQTGEILDMASGEAANVAGTARDQAADVAGQARDQAFEVAGMAKEQAADVASTAKDQAASVVERAKAETADVAETATSEAREMVDTTRTELETQAELQVQQVAESLHRLAGQSLALARGNAEQAGPLGDVVRRAGQELQAVAGGIEERGSSGLVSGAQRVVRQRPRAAIFGTAAVVVAGARLMGTPAGERLKERIAPLKEQAIEAGRNVADELKPLAQERAEQMKSVVTSAADQVKADAEGTVTDVKGTAKQSAKTVKGTAQRSTATVKGTAKRSSTSVKGTAKRTARATTAASRR